jgi:hypothetical protein
MPQSMALMYDAIFLAQREDVQIHRKVVAALLVCSPAFATAAKVPYTQDLAAWSGRVIDKALAGGVDLAELLQAGTVALNFINESPQPNKDEVAEVGKD